MWRLGKKHNAEEDRKKALWYLDYALSVIDIESEKCTEPIDVKGVEDFIDSNTMFTFWKRVLVPFLPCNYTDIQKDSLLWDYTITLQKIPRLEFFDKTKNELSYQHLLMKLKKHVNTLSGCKK